jgi:hypothetical protein
VGSLSDSVLEISNPRDGVTNIFDFSPPIILRINIEEMVLLVLRAVSPNDFEGRKGKISTDAITSLETQGD